MKIYNEIMIDMNPESSDYKKVVSEDSFEYKGDVALCGSTVLTGKSPKYHMGGEMGSPGIAAFASKDRGYMHPSVVPYSAGFQGLAGHPGTITVGKSLLPESGPIRSMKPSNISTGEISEFQWDPGSGQYGPFSDPQKDRGEAYSRATKAYSQAFGEDYYDPYKQKVFGDPVTSGIVSPTGTAGSLLTPLSSIPQVGGHDIIPSDLIDQYGGDFGFEGSSAIEPYILSSQTGQLGSAAEAYAGASEDYGTEMGLLEREEELAKQGKKEEMRGLNLQRQEDLKPYLSEEQQRQANISATGMAHSGPAERRATLERGQTTTGLKDITLQKRGVEQDYQKTMEDISFEKEDVTGAYETAQSDYGDVLQQLVQSGESEMSSAYDWMDDLVTAHEGVASGMEAGYQVPGVRETGYRLRNVKEKAPHVGKQTYEAPVGGWYGEREGGGTIHPGLKRGREQMGAVKQFQDWLATLSGGYIGDYLPTHPDYPTGG